MSAFTSASLLFSPTCGLSMKASATLLPQGSDSSMRRSLAPSASRDDTALMGLLKRSTSCRRRDPCRLTEGSEEESFCSSKVSRVVNLRK